MAFVSLAAESRQDVELFVEHFSVPWPCGYGASYASLARFGTYTGNTIYQIVPTLYLIGADGRIVWTDDAARPRHRISPTEWTKNLDRQIARALGETGAAD